MAVYKFSTNSLKTPLKYSSWLAGNPVFVPWSPSGAYDSIATATAAGGETSFTFSSIPSTYTHLQIRGFAKSSGTSSSIQVILNADTTSGNYARHMLWGTGSGTPASSWGSNAYIGAVSLSGTANVFSASVTDILDYANTSKYKTGRVISGNDTNNTGNAVIEMNSFLWMNTNAITSIQLKIDVGSFSQYTSFALYGIKGA
jgi:hypothetical protein